MIAVLSLASLPENREGARDRETTNAIVDIVGLELGSRSRMRALSFGFGTGSGIATTKNPFSILHSSDGEDEEVRRGE